ncbi:hypothetical protein F7725_006492 [Dissostichus mawsoni]|uniref:Uncharacterized protein n=1 Tax=Dissostichus mawsoni TaxID=36200 RepID=A0A7J5XU27_DISMA|nr:hypothetical protein F7725_006492 [Dissostichus mawsoni]
MCGCEQVMLTADYPDGRLTIGMMKSRQGSGERCGTKSDGCPPSAVELLVDCRATQTLQNTPSPAISKHCLSLQSAFDG